MNEQIRKAVYNVFNRDFPERRRIWNVFYKVERKLARPLSSEFAASISAHQPFWEAIEIKIDLAILEDRLRLKFIKSFQTKLRTTTFKDEKTEKRKMNKQIREAVFDEKLLLAVGQRIYFNAQRATNDKIAYPLAKDRLDTSMVQKHLFPHSLVTFWGAIDLEIYRIIPV